MLGLGKTETLQARRRYISFSKGLGRSRLRPRGGGGRHSHTTWFCRKRQLKKKIYRERRGAPRRPQDAIIFRKMKIAELIPAWGIAGPSCHCSAKLHAPVSASSASKGASEQGEVGEAIFRRAAGVGAGSADRSEVGGTVIGGQGRRCIPSAPRRRPDSVTALSHMALEYCGCGGDGKGKIGRRASVSDP